MQTNNHQFISGQGAAQTNNPSKKNQASYVSAFDIITMDDVENFVKQPQRRSKDKSQWVIFSSLQSRVFNKQRDNGSFGALWADLDKLSGGITIDDVSNVLNAILPQPTAKYYIYHTSSWVPESACYRVIIPLKTTISGKDFIIHQKNLNDKLAGAGVMPDRASERAAQPCYLPNIPLDKDASLYRYHISEGDEFDPKTAFIDEIQGIKDAKRREEESHKERMVNSLNKTIERQASGIGSPIDIFNATYSIEDLFLKYGYLKRGGNWRSPNQESNSYATIIKDSKWVSQSESDAAAGLGTPSSNGGCHGDAFDLYKFYECNNDHNGALKKLGGLFGTTKANQVEYAKRQESKRLATMFESIVPSQHCASTENTLLPFEQLSICQCDIENNQYKDAMNILNYAFDNRLFTLDSRVHWWDGRMFEPVRDSTARKHIGRALASGGGKITDSLIKGVFSIISDNIENLGDSNPDSKHVFFQNGVLEIETGKMLEHAPEFRNTRVLNFDYTPRATPERFLTWLNDIFESDLERIVLLQEIMGWSLTRSTLGIEKGVLFIGVTRAGKGLLIKLMQLILGSAACNFNLNDLNDDKVLSSMIGSNIAFDPEGAEPDKYNVKAIQTVFKSITSNDSITIKKLYKQDPWNGPLNCKLLVAANTMPIMFDDSNATARRWVPLVFEKSFIDDEDTDLLDSMNSELSDIVSWCVDGLQRLNRNRRFTIPKTSKNEMDIISDQGSPITRFINECCLFDESFRMEKSEVNRLYKVWCAQNDEPINPRFIDSIKDSVRGKKVQYKSSMRVNGKVTRGFEGMRVINPHCEDNPQGLYAVAKVG